MKVRDYISVLCERDPAAKYVLYRSVEGDGDNAGLLISEFVNQYGDRELGPCNTYALNNGEISMEQYIKRVH